MNIKIPKITESVSELKRSIRKSPKGFQKQRLTMLYLYRSSQVKTRKQAAELIGVHRKTVGEWLLTYSTEGLDKDRFHQAKSLQIPDNVVLVFLPPYSPELNPIERLWQDIKAKLFENVFTSITQMQNKLTVILNKYTETTIASIVNAEYLTKVENGI